MTFTYVVMSYNYGRYMADNKRGLRAQTQQPDRVLVTDDKSPLDTPEAIRAVWSDIAHAEVVVNERNLGSIPHARRNVGLVRTDAYLQMSADDWLIDPDYVATACRILAENPNVVVVYGPHLAVDPEGQPLAHQHPIDASEPWTLIPGRALRTRMAYENVVSALCPVVRTSVFQLLPPFPDDNDLCADWIHWYLLTTAGDFARLNRRVVAYRMHGQNLHREHDRACRVMRLMDQGYATLLAHPRLDDDDRRHLRAGRARAVLRAATARELPSQFKRFAGSQAGWLALAEAMGERGARLFDGLRDWANARNVRNRAPLP
jgi:hypothetical protein